MSFLEIIITYVIGYLLYYLAPQALVWLNLEPYLIVHEFQIWRLFTWVLVSSLCCFSTIL